MSLRRKSLLIIISISLLLVILIFAATRLILLKSLALLEQDYCLRNVQRVINVISNDNASLLSIAGDYAAWDDTYRFAENHNIGYMETNIIPETLIGLNLNYFLFIDNSMHVFESFGYDHELDQPLPVSDELVKTIETMPADSKLFNSSGTVGIIQLENGSMLFAAHPILTSKRIGPSHGTLIIGRFITDNYVAKLSESTQSDIHIEKYSNIASSDILTSANLLRNSYPPVYIKEIDKNTIAGYSILNDVSDNPAIVVQTRMERDIYNQGSSTILFYIYVLILGSLFFTFGILFLLDKTVISRVAELNRSVKNVRLDIQPVERMPVRGSDEIASLAIGINEMLDSLEKYGSELRQARDELEKKIAERTSELIQLNYELKHEIKERELSENALIETYNENNQILSSISSIIIGVDNSRCVTQWNDNAAGMIGLPANKVMGMNFFQLPIAWDWERIFHDSRRCMENNIKVRMDDLNLEIPGEGSRILGITLTPLILKVGEKPGFLLVGADITERRILEQRLSQSNKMEAIGQMAAGIAHEINTPTQLVGSNLRYIGNQLRDILKLIDQVVVLNQYVRTHSATPEMADALQQSANEAHLDFFRQEAPKAIADSLEGIDRITNIVSAMRYYSHPGSEIKEMGNINQIIENALSLSRNEWKNVAEIHKEFMEGLPFIPCMPSELSQVMLNLIINAVHAIQDVQKEDPNAKGLITISTREIEGDIEVRISDNGTGIPEDIRGKIFDPFFTTKDVGIGTGQGLSICYTVVVNKHNGSLYFETEVGKGTTFIIRLPGK